MTNTDGSLNILHVLRAPVGGLFRHVLDLARGQAARGHRVGVVADATSGGAAAEAALALLSPHLSLGMSRVPMSRHIGTGDLGALGHVRRRAREVDADVVHGHGAKGGAYARLVRKHSAVLAYTPHGGSLHYRWSTPVGALYLTLERALASRADLFLFESTFARDTFCAKVGTPKGILSVVHNGVGEDDFRPVVPSGHGSDLVFIGELRKLKGVDVLIDAIAKLAEDGRKVSATIVGEGPDRVAFEAKAAAKGLGGAVHFVGAQRARKALRLGRLLVVPSRAESMPYVVLEGAAAGVPLIATNVGGIPEIFGPDAGDLVPPADPLALADAIGNALQDRSARHSVSLRLKARMRASFSDDAMTEGVLAAYREALARRGDG